jgi:hypothetical protein
MFGRIAIALVGACVLTGILHIHSVKAQDAEDAPPAPGGSSIAASFEPLTLPVATAKQATGEIKLDGEIDEAAWRRATVVTQFSELWPGDRTEPPIDMEARLTFDDENLYVAFKVFDDPGSVRRTLADRDNMWQDDYVGILLDTYGNNSWAYFLASNPIGVQGDSRIVNGGEEDASFNIVFETEAKITDFGYQVEMAIPFRSLRFPEGESRTWNVNFWVTHPRDSRRQYTWAAIDRNNSCMLCQSGKISGIDNVSAGSNFEFLPALVGAQSAALVNEDNPNSGFEANAVKIAPSLGVKYAFNSNLIGDATLNPDFSQVEADVAQIDVNEPFALFFPERRPFFQEGSDLYETPIQVVYTRSINDPGVAGKLTGRFDRTGAGYLGAADADSPIILPFEESSEIVSGGKSFSNIGRVKQTFGEDNYYGGLITDRRFESGGSGTTINADGLYRFLKSYQFGWQASISHTQEANDLSITEDLDQDLTFNNGKRTAVFDGESFSGSAARLSVSRFTRNWSGMASYETTSPEYRAANGFITQTNRNRFFTWQNHSWWPKDHFFEQVRPHTFFGYESDYSGQRRDIYWWVGSMLRMKGQTTLGFSALLFSHEMYGGVDFRDIQKVWFNLSSNAVEQVGFELEAQIGEFISKGEDIPVLGKGVDLYGGLVIKPIPQLVFEPRIAYSQLTHPDTGDDIFRGYIARLRTNLQFSRRLFLRLVTQYNQFDARFEVDPLLTYKVNPFTAFFIGSTHDYQEFDPFEGQQSNGFRATQRQIFFKIQYLVRT